jgi:hypothetical protein
VSLARYGVMVQDVQDTIATALGSHDHCRGPESGSRSICDTPRDLRDNPKKIANNIPVPIGGIRSRGPRADGKCSSVPRLYPEISGAHPAGDNRISY